MSTQNQPTERTRTRRETIATVAGTVTATIPTIATVAVAETDSGYVEIEVDAVIPSSTSGSISTYEDTQGDGNYDALQTTSLVNGTNRYALDALSGSEGRGVEYWFDLSLETEDTDVTPEIDSLTITLPEEQPEGEQDQPDEPQGLSALWDNYLVFVSVAVMAVGALGALGSKSMAIGALSAYLVFAYIAIETGTTLLTNILYVSLVMILIGFAFKLWRLEGSGDV